MAIKITKNCCDCDDEPSNPCDPCEDDDYCEFVAYTYSGYPDWYIDETWPPPSSSNVTTDYCLYNDWQFTVKVKGQGTLTKLKLYMDGVLTTRNLNVTLTSTPQEIAIACDWKAEDMDPSMTLLARLYINNSSSPCASKAETYTVTRNAPSGMMLLDPPNQAFCFDSSDFASGSVNTMGQDLNFDYWVKCEAQTWKYYLNFHDAGDTLWIGFGHDSSDAKNNWSQIYSGTGTSGNTISKPADKGWCNIRVQEASNSRWWFVHLGNVNDELSFSPSNWNDPCASA